MLDQDLAVYRSFQSRPSAHTARSVLSTVVGKHYDSIQCGLNARTVGYRQPNISAGVLVRPGNGPRPGVENDHHEARIALQLQFDVTDERGYVLVFYKAQRGVFDRVQAIDRPELTHCLKALRAGDTLVVWRLDRLGRNLEDLIRIGRELEARGVTFKSLKEAIDTSGPAGKLIFHMFGALAEFERELIRRRRQSWVVGLFSGAVLSLFLALTTRTMFFAWTFTIATIALIGYCYVLVQLRARRDAQRRRHQFRRVA